MYHNFGINYGWTPEDTRQLLWIEVWELMRILEKAERSREAEGETRYAED